MSEERYRICKVIAMVIALAIFGWIAYSYQVSVRHTRYHIDRDGIVIFDTETGTNKIVKPER